VHALQGVIAEHDAIKMVPLLRELVEKGRGAARVGEGRVSSLVEHGDGERRRKRRRRRRRRGAELARPRTPQPVGFGMTHIPLGIEDDEDLPSPSSTATTRSPIPRPTAAPTSTTVIDTLERLNAFQPTRISSRAIQLLTSPDSIPLRRVRSRCWRRKFRHWRVFLRLLKLIWRRSEVRH